LEKNYIRGIWKLLNSVIKNGSGLWTGNYSKYFVAVITDIKERSISF
jgi:hypothetical protein